MILLFRIVHDEQIDLFRRYHLMIDLKEEINYKVGDCIPFSLEYEALSQLMYHQRMEKYYSEEHTISQRINNLNQSKYINNK